MNTLKSFFPLSWKYSKDVTALVTGIIIHLVAGVLLGAVISLAGLLTGWIPVIGALIGWILGIVSSLLGLYILVGVVLQVLLFFNIIKE